MTELLEVPLVIRSSEIISTCAFRTASTAMESISVGHVLIACGKEIQLRDGENHHRDAHVAIRK